MAAAAAAAAVAPPVPPAPPAPPAPHVFVTGRNQTIADGITEEDSILQMLHWIGFRTAAQRNRVRNDAFPSFEDIVMITDKDIDTMSTTFSGLTQATGRIMFGTSRTKYLKATIHWVEDFYRVSEIPTIVGMDEYSFKNELQRSLAREKIRKSLIKQTSTAADAASPGPLEKEQQWKDWEEKFTNYTRAHLGAKGVPLSYVIRHNDNPDTVTVHPDFLSKSIACAPLSGEDYEADRMTVFNFIVSFTTGYPSGDWVKNTLRFSDGRKSMAALRNHFSGEGNATRSLAEAERLKSTLHYKNERAMAFETYLTQCQKMHNIFEKENEPMTEEAKIRFMFKTVGHADLQPAIEALKVQQTAGAALTYTTCANHISTAVSELPEFLAKNRSISAVGRRDGGSTPSIYTADGTINTGHIENWKAVSSEDKKKVYKERKRLGIKFNGVKKDPKSTSSNSANANTLTQLRKQVKKQRREIKSLKRGSDDNDDDSDAASDAGDQFGGKSSKKKKKVKINSST